jgi:hypothetical protein
MGREARRRLQTERLRDITAWAVARVKFYPSG